MDSVKDPLGTQYKAGNDARFVQLTVTITNRDKDSITADASLVKLVEKDGTEYAADAEHSIWVNKAGESFFLEPINPKMSKSGNVLFAVPNNVKIGDLQLEVQGGFLSSDKARIVLK